MEGRLEPIGESVLEPVPDDSEEEDAGFREELHEVKNRLEDREKTSSEGFQNLFDEAVNPTSFRRYFSPWRALNDLSDQLDTFDEEELRDEAVRRALFLEDADDASKPQSYRYAAEALDDEAAFNADRARKVAMGPIGGGILAGAIDLLDGSIGAFTAFGMLAGGIAVYPVLLNGTATQIDRTEKYSQAFGEQADIWWEAAYIADKGEDYIDEMSEQEMEGLLKDLHPVNSEINQIVQSPLGARVEEKNKLDDGTEVERDYAESWTELFYGRSFKELAADLYIEDNYGEGVLGCIDYLKSNKEYRFRDAARIWYEQVRQLALDTKK